MAQSSSACARLDRARCRNLITAKMSSIGFAIARVQQGAFALFCFLPMAKNKLTEEEGPIALWHWLEDNGEVVFPLIGLLVAALIVVAVRRSSVNSEEELLGRRKQKDTLVRLMRAKLSLTADQAAAELKTDRYHAAALLEELVQEGSLIQGRVQGGVVNFRLKGF